jgi:hypothetical protein
MHVKGQSFILDRIELLLASLQQRENHKRKIRRRQFGGNVTPPWLIDPGLDINSEIVVKLIQPEEYDGGGEEEEEEEEEKLRMPKLVDDYLPRK